MSFVAQKYARALRLVWRVADIPYCGWAALGMNEALWDKQTVPTTGFCPSVSHDPRNGENKGFWLIITADLRKIRWRRISLKSKTGQDPQFHNTLGLVTFRGKHSKRQP